MGGAPEQFGAENLSGRGTTRAEQRRACAFAMDRVPEDGWRDNPAAGTWGVLDVLFAPMNPARVHGSNPSRQWGIARTAWLNRVRAWCVEQGRPRSTTWVPEDEQAAYMAATGDVWPPVELGGGA